MLDSFKNLAYSLVATAPSPADSGTSLVVTAGQGSRFPTAPFNATVWPADSIPTPANAEIVRVTAVAVDTLTITRAQEGTVARTVLVGDQIAATITALTLSTLETDISAVSAAVTSADAHAGTASAAATSADGHAASVSVLAAAASALATSADIHAGTASAAATSADSHANTVSVALASEILNRVSADNVLSGVISALEVRVSALSGAPGGASATSAEVSLVSAQAASALALRAPWLAGVMKVVTNTQSVAVSSLTGLSGLNFSVAAGEQWQFEGMLIVSVSAIAAGLRFGTSVAGGLATTPRFMRVLTHGIAAVQAQSAINSLGAFGLIAQSGVTTILSATSIASAGAAFPVQFWGIVKASAAGNVQLAVAAIASAAASPVHVLAGSYLKALQS